MPSTVLSSTDIYSDEKFIGTAPKEVLYLDVGMAKKKKKKGFVVKVNLW